MPFQSVLPDVKVPECNILSYLFPTTNTSSSINDAAGAQPLWVDAKNPKKCLTAKSALQHVRRLAAGFDRLRLPKGSVVMVVSTNHIYVPIAYLGIAGSGRIFTAANPIYTVGELEHQIKTIRAALILAHPEALPTVTEAASRCGISADRIYQFADEEQQPRGGVKDWRSMLVSNDEGARWTWDALQGQASKDTFAVINFSSGTTGLPKGVCITHHNIVANACQVIAGRLANTSQTVGKPNEDRWLAFLPWYHAYAQLFTLVLTCKLRQTVFAMPRFELEPYIAYIQKHRITTLQLVPPVLVMLSKRQGLEKCDLSSVRYVMSAAAPLKRELQNDISKKLGTVIAQSWGMTETTCTGSMILGESDDRTGSVGSLLPSTEAKLVDEHGKEVLAGEAGELLVRGPQMMKCYWENETATKDTLTSDGWLKTGDVAEHRDGKWYIVDRRKELIKVRGFQVAPAELEALLLEHEQVADAAVVGLPVNDEELPKAYVALQPGTSWSKDEATKAIEEYMTAKVARHKRLTGGITIVDTVPRLLSGKIERKVVKQWANKDARISKTKL
ncbi:hypothetical protein DOTSEDRAFT_68206 [Dothistroma septosporum NZE10]|uniref:Uncharacterized protein n=1 Tax=Dothistroma septosporum (strain NZE10 / CBS 128990) TaxID=675120 RepID=N1Q0P4_DOTSN|nr:hypothetical protein DOTSEDRAFT_68206 [Dothistroma septosporum NZE10]